MKLTEKQKLLVAILIFAISGYVIYSTFFSSPSSVSIDTNMASSTAQSEGQDIIDLANKLDSTVIDSQFFQSAVFKSLIDFDTPISPEPQGRPNPFAVIGTDVGTVNIPVITASTTKKR